MSTVCDALGLRFVAIMSGDVPQEKINAIRVLGRRTGLQLLFDSDETTVECARRLGVQDGWYNPGQYDREWNWRAHYQYLAPQLWLQTKISLLFVPSGTMGTAMGLKLHSHAKRLGGFVIPVLCAEGEEVPGVRTLSSVEKDIRQPWQGVLEKEKVNPEFGKRHEAFCLSHLTWPFVTRHLGPSFGLGFAGALRFLRRHKDAGTLEQFKDREDGKMYVVLFGPDDCRPYINLYLGELRKKELSSKHPPNLLDLLD